MEKILSGNKYFLIGTVLILLLLSIIQFLFLTELFNADFYLALSNVAAGFILFLSISLIIRYPLKFIAEIDQSIIIFIFSSVVIAIISTAIWYLGLIFLSKSLSLLHEEFIYSYLPLRITFAFLVFLLIISINYISIFYSKFKDKTSTEIELNNIVSESELKFLKYQINPHFIFNALNSISSLTLTSPEQAQEMTINLSNFLRKTLAANDVKLISINEEIDNLKLYLKIEKVRFDERLEFQFVIDDGIKNALIPNMILQPLVENTIKHGVHESNEIISVNIICKEVGNFLEIVIKNNYDNESSSEKGEGVGLSNINRRLKLLYKRNDLIAISKKDNIFSVTIKIPIERFAHNA